MTAREALHRLVDDLSEDDLNTAVRILEALKKTGDPVERALREALMDDESDDDNIEGGLSEAHRQVEDGNLFRHVEIRRKFGL